MRNKSYALRYKANQPTERVFIDSEIAQGAGLEGSDTLSIMVWNIFKQQKAEWLAVLQHYATNCQLVLLQEAQTTPDLIDFATSHYLVTDQVPALRFPLPPSGVMTLAAAHPLYCCPLRQTEPLLRLAKSALITVYPLFDSRLLMVVNIHAINFSLGVNVYHQQLETIAEQIAQHSGPVIMAGDFNTWSRQRLHGLYLLSRKLRLSEVRFDEDYRKTAFGLPLDFIFYKGLKVSDSRTITTRASDHNPMLVTFNISQH